MFFRVLVPPQWAADAPPKNITIVSEKNGTLECKVTASPPAEVLWYKNGKLLQPSEYVHFDFLYVTRHNIENKMKMTRSLSHAQFSSEEDWDSI